MSVPLLVDLRRRRVVCVGAGPVAAAKALPLLDDGADLVVVAPDAVDGIRVAAAAGRLNWHRRAYRADDLDGALLVVAGTQDPATNARVAADADRRAALCVRVDVEGDGSVAFLGAVRQGPLVLAVSTSGRSPALASRIRAELAAAYGPEYGQLAELLGQLRRSPEVRARMATLPVAERRARWRAVLDADILRHIRNGQLETATEVASACLFSSSA